MARVSGLLARAHALALDTRPPVARLAPDLVRAARFAPRGAGIVLATGLDAPGPGLDAALAGLARRGPLRLLLAEDAFETAPPAAALPFSPPTAASPAPASPRSPRPGPPAFAALRLAGARPRAPLARPPRPLARGPSRPPGPVDPAIVAALHPPRLPAAFIGTGWQDLLAAFGLGLLLAAPSPSRCSRPLLRPRVRRAGLAARLVRLEALPARRPARRAARPPPPSAARRCPTTSAPPSTADAARPRRLDDLILGRRRPCLTSPFPSPSCSLPLPLLVRLLPPRGAGGQALYLPPGDRRRRRPASRAAGSTAPASLLAAFWLFLVTAAAGPQRLVEVPDRTASGRDIVLALDLSGSMAIEDFSLDGETASRLDAVKRVASRFVEARRGDRIGVVIFADRAYVAAPLTWDLTAVARAIDSAEIGLTGRSTAISDGLGLALKRILAEPARSRVIVLLSDGRDTAARLDPRQVARLAAENGVRVHTIALGPEDLEERPASRDAVDIATLRDIAGTSGGRTWRVRDMADLDGDGRRPRPARAQSLRPAAADRARARSGPGPPPLALALGLAVAWRRA